MTAPSFVPDTALPEPVLVERAQDGDDSAFEILLRRHQDTVYRITLRILREPGDARDAAQEALITAWRKLPTLREPAGFGAWLRRIAGRRALNVLRARADTDPIDEESAPDLPGREPDAEVLAGDLREALSRALSGLPPSQRTCWVLREMEGWGYEEIAEVVDATPTAVRGRIHRARAHLVKALAPWR
ncbi:sigma-70 family RNA polymerase sigma factor [Nocardiopsis sp. N85]|uniref:RNA polymerase sigma factor n=1 Tax=Nocardiopsis sp. N85 TaxID=3029400 RepID=UPI00237F32D0|nr:sigma-70 family RNA polymerase sigma factor [Nocardiopsis sp. N85]MDE3723505.1 sigma-70 family RNA polymerase sigma factor [Nocardiopsis sp. N85]